MVENEGVNLMGDVLRFFVSLTGRYDIRCNY